MKQLTLVLFLIISLACATKQNNPKSLVLGAERFESYLNLLQGKRVALIVNQTSMVGSTHLVDTLISLQVNIKKIFGPEHGFRGAAYDGEYVDDGIDLKTNLPIISLYGKHKKPTLADFENIDVVIFDIQDVGTRFYTYISTMHYAMEACAEQSKKFIVLDRPNPNGHYIAGPVLDLKFKSFVGMHPIPIVHGLTVGELATMINNEKWLPNGITCDLEIIKMNGYTHSIRYKLPVKPSPNLPNSRSIELYPSLCLLEPTIISIGRGTTFPFQVVGHPDSMPGAFSFKPASIEGVSKYPKHENKTCYGEDLRKGPPTTFSISYLIKYYSKYKDDSFFNSKSYFDKLVGNDILRTQLKNGIPQEEIESSWEPELNKYTILRRKYLLYADFQ